MTDAASHAPEQTVCIHCGGWVRPVAGPGRVFRHHGAAYPIPDDLPLLTCDDCGAQRTTPESARALGGLVTAARVAPSGPGG